MRKIKEMPTEGDAWEIENVSGFTMATTAAVKNRLDVVRAIVLLHGGGQYDDRGADAFQV